MTRPGGLVPGSDPLAWNGLVAVLGDGGTRLGPKPVEDGGLWLLPERGLVVVREHRQSGGWRCAVIARRVSVRGRDDRWHVDVTEPEWAAGSGTLMVDADADPDAAAMLWLVRVWQHWPGRRVYLLARHLVEVVRAPGRWELDLSPVAMRRLVHSCRVRPDLARRVVDRLTREGFLTPSRTATVGGLRYGFSLPHHCVDPTDATPG